MGTFPDFPGQLLVATLPTVAKSSTAPTLSVSAPIVKNAPSSLNECLVVPGSALTAPRVYADIERERRSVQPLVDALRIPVGIVQVVLQARTLSV